MLVIFSDLDGTLLDESYSFDAAKPALALLRREGVPLVLLSSKTRAEMIEWRKRLGIRGAPFVVENGGAVVWGGETVALGAPYAELLRDLEAASRASGCRVRGFHQMDAAEIARIAGMTVEWAALAKHREYDEPFQVLDAGKAADLEAAIERLGKRCVRGGRFYHITGANDKAAAVRVVAERYPGAITAGLGDAPNDLSMLRAVQVPVIVRSKFTSDMAAALPSARVTAKPGPAGWNEAVIELLGGRSRRGPRG
jgi:mannosyl-3-phosphoglycerate phosphatase